MTFLSVSFCKKARIRNKKERSGTFKAYKYRIYPNKTQIRLIEKYFGSTRLLYNYFLEYRQKVYANGNKKVGYMLTQAELAKLKKLHEYVWLNEYGSQSLQMSLRDLDSAYGKFFKNREDILNSNQRSTAPQNIKIANNRALEFNHFMPRPATKEKTIYIKYLMR